MSSRTDTRATPRRRSPIRFVWWATLPLLSTSVDSPHPTLSTAPSAQRFLLSINSLLPFVGCFAALGTITVHCAGVLLQGATGWSSAARRRARPERQTGASLHIESDCGGEGARTHARRVGGGLALRDAARRLAVAASRRDHRSTRRFLTQLLTPASETHDRYLILRLYCSCHFYSIVRIEASPFSFISNKSNVHQYRNTVILI